jgi:hypothetical protein
MYEGRLENIQKNVHIFFTIVPLLHTHKNINSALPVVEVTYLTFTIHLSFVMVCHHGCFANHVHERRNVQSLDICD